MAYVNVPKDLAKIKSKVLFNLTKRQLICFGLAALMGVPLFFLLKGGIGTTAAAMVMIVVMLPGFLFGVYEKNGQPLEVVGRQIIESCFLRPKERVLAYAVVLSGMESGKVKGSIYELDYAAKAELAIQTALWTDNNRLIYENGSRELPKEYRFEATPDREYGKFVRYEAVPHDPDALRDLLRDESRKRERLKPGNFKEHIGRLSDEKVLAEAQRLSAAFQSLQAPNSPNGTHFVVEVSPWFERIASSKEHERLFALLPYKTLYLSSVKDRHGVFAFISKDERCDLPLRKQRPSVRAQLKEGQSKKAAAHKKAAAKSKDNDLEV